jgi:UTP--glucose-1-phosphate uridylyltransferase
VLEYIVREAAAAGIEDILIVTNRGKEAIEDYFDYAPALEASLAAAGRRTT